MNEENKGNEVIEEVEAAATEERAGEETIGRYDSVKKYTDSDVDKIVARKIKRERDRLKKLFNEEQEVSELEQRENNVRLRELKADAREALAERGLPGILANVLDYSDEESLKKSMDEVSEAFFAAVEHEVKTRISGSVPRKSYGGAGSAAGNAIAKAFKP